MAKGVRLSPVVEDHQVVGGGVGGQGLPQHLHLCKDREGWGRPGFPQKGHALAEKAGARTDFSYVPGHLGEF